MFIVHSPYSWMWQLDMSFLHNSTAKLKKHMGFSQLSEASTRFEFEHLCYAISILVMLNFVIG